MSQQTSMYNFYKSVNPKSQLTQKKHVTATPNVSPLKNSANNKKVRSFRKALMKSSIPTTLVKKSPEVIDLIDSDDEANSKAKIKLEFSYDNEPVTPTKDKSLKRSISDNTGTSSPCKKHLNNGSKAVVKDSFDSDDEWEPWPTIKRGSSCENEVPITPTKKETVKRSPSKSDGPSSPRKKQLTNGAREAVKHLKHRVQVKVFHETIDTGKVSDMIENLNLRRNGTIPKSRYNLEQYYAGIKVKPKVEEYRVSGSSSSYDIKKVIIPREKHAEHLFKIITDVFSHPNNCGYFDDQELDQIFGIISLSEKAQMLFVRMIKRKYFWRRAVVFDYPEISQDLRPYLDELEKQRLIRSDTDHLSLETLLAMLPADDVRELCRQMKQPSKANKETCVQQLLKITSIKPLFPGMDSPATALRGKVLTSLGHCVCLPEEVINLVDRIVTLLMPSEDVTTKMVDIFLKLTMIKEGTLRFPEVPVQPDPVFQDREHLIRYVEQRNKWRDAMDPPKDPKENVDLLRTLGRDAHARLMVLLGQNQLSSKETQLPRHVQRFREEYVCVKTVTSCLEVFKKDKSTLPEAVRILRDLISQEALLQGKKGDWYEELALIEMYHKKDPETAALVTIEGLRLEKISETSRHLLNKRAATLSKRKGVSQAKKSELQELMEKEIQWNTPKVSIGGNALQGNHPGRKSTWKMDMEGGDKGYMSVEHRAQVYYKKNGYPEGWHCEGSLPVTLFTLLMWDEIYSVPVPAAYLSAYQKAPLDLYTSDFYNNRKEQINKRIMEIRRMSADELGDTIFQSLEIRQHYESLMPTSLFLTGNQLRDVVRCIGTPVVSGICERLALNFYGWRAGFPDLLVWNSFELKCKFVEVKGPGDVLSAKQTLWLRYLEDLGAATELCELKARSKKQ